jgi:hypothetical protein
MTTRKKPKTNVAPAIVDHLLTLRERADVLRLPVPQNLSHLALGWWRTSVKLLFFIDAPPALHVLGRI